MQESRRERLGGGGLEGDTSDGGVLEDAVFVGRVLKGDTWWGSHTGRHVVRKSWRRLCLVGEFCRETHGGRGCVC